MVLLKLNILVDAALRFDQGILGNYDIWAEYIMDTFKMSRYDMYFTTGSNNIIYLLYF